MYKSECLVFSSPNTEDAKRELKCIGALKKSITVQTQERRKSRGKEEVSGNNKLHFREENSEVQLTVQHEYTMRNE